METHCLLCARPLGSIVALVPVGDVMQPDHGALCRACVALSPEQRRTLRDAAMARQLAEAATTDAHRPS
jgi:hypothetical protein